MANVKYKNAPVSEVILGVTFKDGLLARNNYFIEIIHEFLNEYPLYQVVQPLANDSFQTPHEGLIIDTNHTGPLLHRLRSKDSNWLVQIQFNKVFLNWIRDDNKEVGNYPGFSLIFDKFKALLDKVLNRTDSNELDILYTELTYHDRIDNDNVIENLNSTINFSLPNFKTKSLKTTDFSTSTYSIVEELGGFLVLNVLALPNSLNKRILKIEATLKSNSPNALSNKWFDKAHQFQVEIFEELIKKETLDKWK
jgi:uncharacterized protein (TIGR04255 family)